ncbi:protein toll-like [Saccostrea cucullata]|uniref:protein toll-like n=1 Tax=Saccostrea cuccullata TaxID=36930 RepID=UPI002ED43D2F
MCPNSCTKEEIKNRCCACKSKPIWEIFSNISYKPLYMEYLNPTGHCKIVTNETLTGFKWILHQGGRMTQLPNNICSFSDILVTVDFQRNRLSNIEGINCLKALDSLDVSYNDIQFITNTTFKNMPNLRILRMAHTGIKSLQPYIFELQNTEIFVIDLSHNHFDNLHISNIYPKRSVFCNISFDESNLTLTDVPEFKISLQESYGGGDIIFGTCKTNKHPLSVIFKEPSEIKKAYQYNHTGAFEFSKLTMPCDCHLGELLLSEKDMFERFYSIPNKTQYICLSPENMKGIDVLKTFNNISVFDQFICHKTNFCPEKCTCIEQPSQMRMLVDCSNANLTKIPDIVPQTNYDIELNCSNNKITKLTSPKTLNNHSYLSNITLFDLSKNEVQTIEDKFLEKFNKTSSRLKSLLLLDHKLIELPVLFKSIDPDKVWFGKNSVSCECKDEWIASWRSSVQNKSSNPLFCTNANGVRQAAEEAFSDCYEDEFDQIIFNLFLIPAVVLVTAAVAIYFRYDFVILKNRLVDHRKKTYKYDIFILSDDSNVDVNKFAIDIFLYLKKEGYKCFYPPVDEDVGTIRHIHLDKEIKSSRNIIIIISKPLQNDNFDDLTFRMNQAWKLLSENQVENLLVVLFDGKITDEKWRFPYVRALRRFKRVLNVCSRKYNVKIKISETLPPPEVRTSISFTELHALGELE